MPVPGPSPEERREIVRLYRDDWWTLPQIGDHLHWSATAVRNALLREGVRLRSRAHRNWRHRTLSQADIRLTIELYQHGAEDGGPLSVAEVAERVGRSPSAVWRRLKLAGELRPAHVTLAQTVRFR